MAEGSRTQAGFRGRVESGFESGRQRGSDLLQTVRERPLLALGAVFGAGVLLALVSARGEDEGEDEIAEVVRDSVPDDPEARAALWERRARRLQRLAREQEEELRHLRGKGASARGARDEDQEDDEDAPGAGIADLFRAGLQRIVRNAGADA